MTPDHHLPRLSDLLLLVAVNALVWWAIWELVT